MPCYSIDESGIRITNTTNPELLAQALRELGYTVTKLGGSLSFAHYERGQRGTFKDGELSVRSDSGPVDQNEIRRAYSAQVVMSAAKRFGWQVKQESPTKFQVTRRA